MDIVEILNTLKEWLDNLLANSGIFAPLLACLFIVLEAVFPFLPLFLFISINFLAFGNTLGFIISWILTIVGSYLVYILIKKGFYNKFSKYVKDKQKLTKTKDYINNIKLTQLTVIIAIPFTPSFLINIAAALSDIPTKKYLISLIIGKISTVFFWGFIGKSLIDSLTDIKTIIIILLMIIVVYIISLIINKYLKLKN